MSRRVVCVVMLVLSAIAVTSPAKADPDDVANAVSRKIMSPFCPGLTLHDCPSDAAADLREQIAGWANQGWSEERIIDHLSSEDEFGPGILATPPTDGSGLFAWLLPLFALLAALGLGFFLARRWSRRSPEPAPGGQPGVDPETRGRLEAELREIRERA